MRKYNLASRRKQNANFLILTPSKIIGEVCRRLRYLNEVTDAKFGLLSSHRVYRSLLFLKVNLFRGLSHGVNLLFQYL